MAVLHAGLAERQGQLQDLGIIAPEAPLEGLGRVASTLCRAIDLHAHGYKHQGLNSSSRAILHQHICLALPQGEIPPLNKKHPRETTTFN